MIDPYAALILGLGFVVEALLLIAFLTRSDGCHDSGRDSPPGACAPPRSPPSPRRCYARMRQ